jgi:hypothetical protein
MDRFGNVIIDVGAMLDEVIGAAQKGQGSL